MLQNIYSDGKFYNKFIFYRNNLLQQDPDITKRMAPPFLKTN